MPLITWDDSFSVGNATIDSQHKQLFAILNDIYDGRNSLGRDAGIREAFAKLKDYAIYHFTAEEALAGQLDGDYQRLQAQEHEEFKQHLAYLEQRLDQDKQVYLSALSFVADWLQTHIKGTDQRFNYYMA